MICKSKVADGKMRMFNLDGSEGKMCGNGIRCVAKFMRDKGLVDKDKFTIETLSGIIGVELMRHYGEVVGARVDMGKAILDPAQIPVNLEGEKVINKPAVIGDREWNITCVSMGNPHCVTFVKNVDTFELEKYGPMFEYNELFPERVNAEFVQTVDRNTLKMRVWERGSGETWACGTGACASVVAACENGYCNKDEDVTVKLIGGELTVRYTSDGEVYLTGNAVNVFDGEVII